MNKQLTAEMMSELKDPLKFAQLLWPSVSFYREQRMVIQSVEDNDETFVPAGNKLGKDFVAAFIALRFFLTRLPCRVVTTSAKDDHLRVLWGEIMRFVQTAAIPLDHREGGPLIVNHQDLKKMVGGKRCPLSYMVGMVASQDSIAAMQGHHVAKTGDGVPRTLFVADESSSVQDEYWKMASTWCNRALVIGNTWPCSNFFFRGVKGGDLRAEDGVGGVNGGNGLANGNGTTSGRVRHLYRKVIKIKAEDSPNVRLALEQQRRGVVPSGQMVVDGVKDWAEYVKNRATWDAQQQCVSLDAEFYEGAEVKLFPPDRLDRAQNIHRALLASGRPRKAKAVGIDPAEGGDKTAMAAVDELGLIEIVSKKTPDTSVITGEALAFARRHGVPATMVFFDRGGGGKEHADRLRSQGFGVQTVAFGEPVTMEIKRTRVVRPVSERMELTEERYAYVNRRAEMYGELSLLLDPSLNPRGFALPLSLSDGPACADLRVQLVAFPKTYDSEGRLKLPPKNKRSKDSKEVSLTELIGHSPDEADALVLAVHGMQRKPQGVVAGAL